MYINMYRVCIYIWTYVYIYVHIYIYIHVYIYIYTSVYLYNLIHIYMYTCGHCMCMYCCGQQCIHSWWSHRRRARKWGDRTRCVRTCVHTRIYIHTLVYSYILYHLYITIHVSIQMYTQLHTFMIICRHYISINFYSTVIDLFYSFFLFYSIPKP